jgi:hypothetical protein
MSDERSDNPYANQGVQVRSEGATAATNASRAIAEVQAQVIMARKYPRDPLAATNTILAECDMPEFARVALYNFPRGDTRVEGPSIRMAEVLARAWGNVMSGTIEVERDGNESSMLAYAWDLESNVMKRREFKVAHVRDSRKGGKVAVTEERDIYEVGANAASRRERACILALIPGHVVNAAVDRVKKTLAAEVGNPLERAHVMLEKFEKEYRVTKLQIEKRLKHRIEAISVAEILSLGQIYNSLADGFGTADDYFDPVDHGPMSTTAEKAAAAARRAAKPPATANNRQEDKSPAKTQQNRIAGEYDDGSGIPDTI